MTMFEANIAKRLKERKRKKEYLQVSFSHFISSFYLEILGKRLKEKRSSDHSFPPFLFYPLSLNYNKPVTFPSLLSSHLKTS
jgi:hypothetical protein